MRWWWCKTTALMSSRAIESPCRWSRWQSCWARALGWSRFGKQSPACFGPRPTAAACHLCSSRVRPTPARPPSPTRCTAPARAATRARALDDLLHRRVGRLVYTALVGRHPDDAGDPRSSHSREVASGVSQRARRAGDRHDRRAGREGPGPRAGGRVRREALHVGWSGGAAGLHGASRAHRGEGPAADPGAPGGRAHHPHRVRERVLLPAAPRNLAWRGQGGAGTGHGG